VAGGEAMNGIPLPTIMFLIFLVLKLTNQVDWSWWWVTAPLWGGFIFFFVAIALLAIVKEFAE
jgi:hypothetical protein